MKASSRAIEAASGALGRAGFRYALVGGAAMPAWGRLRATQDADLLLALDWSSDRGEELVASLVGRVKVALILFAFPFPRVR